jgi:predicted DNA-binding transcriptional regulator AlpA
MRQKKPFPAMPKAVPVAEPATLTGPVKLLSKKQVLEIFGVSHVTLRDWIRRGIFPPPVVLGPDGGGRSTIAWIDSEVYAHIANAPRRLPTGATWSAEDQPCFTTADLNEHMEILLKLARSCFDCGEDEEKRSYWGATLEDLEESFAESRASE